MPYDANAKFTILLMQEISGISILLMQLQIRFLKPKSIIFARMKRQRIAEDLHFLNSHTLA